MTKCNERVTAPIGFLLFSLALLFTGLPLWAKFDDPLDHAALKQSEPSKQPLLMVDASSRGLVAVGPRGLIVVSEDGGATWNQVEVPVQSDLVAVDFSGRASGWAVGHDGVILHSNDGGRTWTRQLDGRLAKERFTAYYQEMIAAGDESVADALDLVELNYRDGPALPFLDVLFQDDQNGTVVGAFGLIAVTSDGGKTWEPWLHKIDNVEGLHLNSVDQVGDDIFIASERGYVFKLDREQSRFTAIQTPYEGTFFGLTGNREVVLAYGLRGTIYRSTDGGANWEEVPTDSASAINHGSPQGSEGFVFGNQTGELLLSERGSNRFKVVKANGSMHITSVMALKDRGLVLTGLEGIAVMALPDKAN